MYGRLPWLRFRLPFNATVFDRALDSIILNATFSDAACADVAASTITVDNEVTLPLVVAARRGHGSAHAYVTEALEVAVLQFLKLYCCKPQ